MLRGIVVAGGLVLATAGAAWAQEEEGPSDFRLDVGGYGSFRFDASDADQGARGFTLRRFVLTTDARWRDRLQVYSEIEYERFSEIEIERGVEAQDGGLAFEQELEGTNGSEIALEQGWGEFRFTDAVGLRFGAVLPPVGRFNLNHDDNVWSFARRPLVDRGASVLPVKAAWTEMGLGLVGEVTAGETPITWQAYVLNGAQLDFAIEEKVQTRDPARDKLELEAVVQPTRGAFDGSNRADAVAGRVAVSPALGSEIAVSGYAGRYTPDWLDHDAFISTIAVDGRHRLGPLTIEGEWMRTQYGELNRVIESFAAAALDHAAETESDETAGLESEIEVALTGVSDTRSGFWVDLGWPIALARGTWGLDDAVVTPVARIERVQWDGNLEELDFAGGQVTSQVREDRAQTRVSLGVAFRPMPQAVFQLAYEHNRATQGAMIDPGVEEKTTNGIVFGMAVGF